MSANITNQVAYLRTSREFPEDLHQLCVEVDKSYIDIANTVNARTIGLFPTNRPAVTGESWFLQGNRRQQTLRQVYNINSFSPVNHGLNLSSITAFTVIRACAVNNVNLWYPIPYVDATNAGNDVGIYVSSTQILFTTGGGQSITSGVVVLEWLSQV